MSDDHVVGLKALPKFTGMGSYNILIARKMHGFPKPEWHRDGSRHIVKWSKAEILNWMLVNRELPFVDAALKKGEFK